MNKRTFVWVTLFTLSILLAIRVIPGMLTYTHNIASGSKYADFIDKGVDHEFAKAQALHIGTITAGLYFFAFPIPCLILLNLIFAYVARIEWVRHYFVVWWAGLVVALFGFIFLSFSMAMWWPRSLQDVLMGSFGIWILILLLYYLLQTVIWFINKIYLRKTSN